MPVQFFHKSEKDARRPPLAATVIAVNNADGTAADLLITDRAGRQFVRAGVPIRPDASATDYFFCTPVQSADSATASGK